MPTDTSGLIGYARIATRLGHANESEDARRRAAEQAGAIVENWRAGASPELDRAFTSVAELDRWIGEGNGAFFFSLGGHKRKVAKYYGLTPEVGRLIADHALSAATRYMAFVDRSLPGWFLAGEERQYHFGENFIDYPDFSLGIFEAKAMIHRVSASELMRYVDIPWCEGDLYYIEKLAWVLRVAAE